MNEQHGRGRWIEYLEGSMPGDVESAVDADLARATAGTRIRIVGSEAFVTRLTAAALRSGAVEEEVVGVVDPAAAARMPARLFCTACGAILEIPVADGGTVVCSACDASLTAHPRYSLSRGAYLGFPGSSSAPLPGARE